MNYSSPSNFKISNKKKKINIARVYWANVRIKQKNLARSRICSCVSEIDQHMVVTTIYINNEKIIGLLDSGASVSCLGHNAIEILNKLNLSYKPINQNILTADGAAQKIKGVVTVQITYKGKTKSIELYIVPSLSQSLYLGIDFWKKFKLAPSLVSEVKLDPEKNENIHDLSPSQSNTLEIVKSLFPSSSIEGLGKTSILLHKIDVGDTSPIKQRHYPVSPAIQKLMYKEVDRMIELGVIEESHSGWSSPIVLVRRSNGKARLCLDSRSVNTATKKDAYPMPNIEGIIGRLDATRYISSIDLKDAFWQIPLDDSSKEKTAFSIPGRPLYQFARMPFGLCNAAQTMCRLMDKVIPNELKESVFVFIDDLLVVSADFETHISLLTQVAFHLRKANLTINVEKSKFVMKEVKYLGYVVGNGVVKTDPEKIKSIVDFPPPVTVKQIRRFLGMCGWYRRFISNYSDISVPITDLLKKNEKLKWTPEAQSAFEKLKECLVAAPVLANPDFSRQFNLQCDASQTGVGCVLYQVNDNGEEHPVAFMSQKLNSAQRNYSITELECLAAVLAVKKFRAYIEGSHFKIITDHASLKWLMSQKDLSGRLARWSLKLQSFDFEVEYRKGTANIVPDTLSRIYSDAITTATYQEFIDLQDDEFESDDYKKIRSAIVKEKDSLPDVKVIGPHVFKRCFINDQDPSSTWKLWIPNNLSEKVIKSCHDITTSAHGGFAKTLEKIRRWYYWPKMSWHVKEYVQKCEACRECKAPNYTLRPPMGHQISVERPFQRLYVDLLGPYPRSKKGNTHLLIVLDQFSKFVFLKTLRVARSGTIVEFLRSDVFNVYGVPESIFSDNGAQFTSKEFADCLTSYGINQIFTASHSPQANASERVNRSILAAIRTYIDDDQRTWDENISSIASALRNSIHSSVKFTPHYIVFGSHKIEHASAYALLRRLGSLSEPDIEVVPKSDLRQLVGFDVLKNLKNAHDRVEKTYNLRSRPVEFSPGQEVYRRNFAQSDFSNNYNAKLGKKFIKCRILRKLGTALYELVDMNGKKLPYTYHAKDIKQ